MREISFIKKRIFAEAPPPPPPTLIQLVGISTSLLSWVLRRWWFNIGTFHRRSKMNLNVINLPLSAPPTIFL